MLAYLLLLLLFLILCFHISTVRVWDWMILPTNIHEEPTAHQAPWRIPFRSWDLALPMACPHEGHSPGPSPPHFRSSRSTKASSHPSVKYRTRMRRPSDPGVVKTTGPFFLWILFNWKFCLFCFSYFFNGSMLRNNKILATESHKL